MDNPKFGYRKSIIEVLQDIAADIPRETFVELVCSWFDDFYLPCTDPVGFRPGVHHQGILDFNSCFTESELKAMAQFHSVFDSRISEIPKDIAREALQAHSAWRAVQLAAKDALEAFARAETPR